MGNSIFSWRNAIDAATFAAGSEAATLPSANLATKRKGRVWRSLVTNSYFVATFAAPTEIDVLALGGCTLGLTDQIRHRLYDAAGVELLDETVDADVADGYGLHVNLLDSPLTVASWRCDITATSRSTAGYFDIKRAWAAPKLQPEIGIARPYGDAWKDDADVARNPRSGGIFTGDGARYRNVSVELKSISEEEKPDFMDMAREVGRMRNQLLVIPNQNFDLGRTAILGRFEEIQPLTGSLDIEPPVYGQSFSIIQDL